MSPSSMHDIDATHHRRGAARPREVEPLFTHEPLSHDRERRPPAQPAKKRKTRPPEGPALTFHPKGNHVPSGRQDPPGPPPVSSRPSASDPSAISYHEQQTTTFADREIHDQFRDGYVDAQQKRISPEHSSSGHFSSSYPDTPCTDVNDACSAAPDPYDSPVSYTSSSPASSDQSSGAAEYTAQVPGFQVHPPPMCSYSGPVYVPQAVVHQDTYGSSMDLSPNRLGQGYPVQYFDPVYGRAGSHSAPAYSGNNGYSYPPYKY